MTSFSRSAMIRLGPRVILALSLLWMPGCDDASTGGGRGRARGRGAGAKAAKKAEAVNKVTSLPGIRVVDWDKEDDLSKANSKVNFEFRDPFQVFYEDEVIEELKPTGPVISRDDVSVDVLPAQLRLTAIITGTAVHKAMVTDGHGDGHIVRRGDIVSSEKPHRIIRITSNEVVFKPLQPPEPGAEPEFLIKRLWSEQELELRQ